MSKLGAVSLNMFWNPSISGSSFLQASMKGIHTYAVRLDKVNILGGTKFGTLNRQLDSMDGWLGKIQKKTALISRKPLTMVNAKGARDGLKEQLRTQNAIEKSAKQTAFHSRNHASNRGKVVTNSKSRDKAFYTNTKNKVKDRAKVAGAVIVGSAIGAVTSLSPIRKSIDFETSMADVTKATNATDIQTNMLKQNILKQVKKGSLLSATQIAEIQAGGGRSGVGIKQLPMFTSDIAKGSVAMDLSTGEAGRQFAKMAERMDLPISKINIMTNAFTHLENNGANSARDLINTTGRLSGIFKELKFSPQSSAGLSNYMNTLEVSPELAATSFKILNNRFKKTNSKFHYFSRLQKKGAGELKNIIIDINKSMSKQQIMKTFGAQGANVISKMSGDLKNLDKSLKLVSGNKFMSAVDNEYAIKMNTTGAKETMAQNRIEGGSIVFGDKIKHQYISFLNFVSKGIMKLTHFYSTNEKLIKSIGGLGVKVVAVAMAIKAIGWVSSPFVGILKGLIAVTGATNKATIAQRIFNGVVRMSPFILVGTLVAGAVLAFADWNAVVGFGKGVLLGFNDGMRVLGGMVEPIAKWLTTASNKASDFAKNMGFAGWKTKEASDFGFKFGQMLPLVISGFMGVKLASKIAGVALGLFGTKTKVVGTGVGILSNAISGMAMNAKKPLKFTAQLPKSKSLLSKFKSLMSGLLGFAKKNPIIIGAVLAGGAVYAGLQHMAKNAKPLVERQKQKGIGRSLQIKPVNNVLYDPTKKPVQKKIQKGFSLKDQLGLTSVAPVNLSSPSAITQNHMDQVKAVTTNNNQQTHQTFHNKITVTVQDGKFDEHEFERTLNRIQRNAKHNEQDTQMKDAV